MYKKLRNVFFLSVVILFYSCKSTASLSEITALKKVVSEKSFEIAANSATPVAFVNVRGIENLLPPGSTQGLINLVSTQNYVKIKKDSLLMDLPYFGELQIAGGYTSEAGLKFEGIPDSSKVTFNSKNNTYLIEYTLKLKNEILRISLTMYASRSCYFVINSSNRTTITYNGKWKELQ